MPLDVDAIVFDLDDTLCEYERTAEELLAVAFDRVGVDPFVDGPTYRERFDECFPEFEEIDALRRHCFATIARERGRDPDLGRTVADVYADERHPPTIQPRPGAPETVHELAEQFPVGLITNGDAAIQRPKLEQTGLDGAFDVVVFAGDETAAKPDPEPFERALAALDVAPGRTAFVGNSLRGDVGGAAPLGLTTVWTPADPDLPEDVEDPGAVTGDHPAVEPAPDYVLAGVEELPALLDGAP